MDFNEWIKETWIVQDEYEPPFGHAELLSLKVFIRKMEIDLVKAAQEPKPVGLHLEVLRRLLRVSA